MRCWLIAVLLVAMSPAFGAASGIEDDICVGPAIVYGVTATIALPQSEIDAFVKGLHQFASRHSYYYMPGPSTKTDRTHIDVLLQKKGESAGIEISNMEDPGTADEPGTMVMTSGRCGDESFEPSWREFLRFLRKYVAGEKAAMKH